MNNRELAGKLAAATRLWVSSAITRPTCNPLDELLCCVLDEELEGGGRMMTADGTDPKDAVTEIPRESAAPDHTPTPQYTTTTKLLDEIDAADEARDDVIATVLQIIHEWETKANNYDRSDVAYTLSLLSEDIKRRFEVEDRDDLNAALNVALTLPRDGTVDLADVKRELGVEK